MRIISFGCWDIFEDNGYEAALHAGVLDKSTLEQVREPLEAIKPMSAVFDSEYVKRIDGPNKKAKGSKRDQAEMLMDDIRQFKEKTRCVAALDDLVRVHRSISSRRRRCMPL